MEEIRQALIATRNEIKKSPWYPVLKQALIDTKNSEAAKVMVDTVKSGVIGAGKLMYGIGKGIAKELYRTGAGNSLLAHLLAHLLAVAPFCNGWLCSQPYPSLCV